MYPHLRLSRMQPVLRAWETKMVKKLHLGDTRPFGPWGKEGVCEQWMLVRIVQEDHQCTSLLELWSVVRVTQNQSPAPKRNHNRAVRKWFAVNNTKRSRPDVYLTIIFCRNIIHEDSCPHRVNPHKKRGSRIDHRKGRHRCYPP